MKNTLGSPLIECIIKENVDKVDNFRNHATNWQMHRQELRKRIPMLPPFQPENKEDLDILVKQFTDSCRQALDVDCPITRSKGRIRALWLSLVLNNIEDCRKQFHLAKLSPGVGIQRISGQLVVPHFS